jgi:hypothetical protein
MMRDFERRKQSVWEASAQGRNEKKMEKSRKFAFLRDFCHHRAR